MQEEFELLVKAIDGLRQESNYFKDYVFPISSAFFSALLGAGIAYLTLRYQNRVHIEHDKIDAVNRWTLMVGQACHSLMAIKANYCEGLTNNPIERASKIPNMLFHATPIMERIDDLSFVTPKHDVDSSKINEWSQVSRIWAMIENYNNLLAIWEKRNQINMPIRERILKHSSNKASVYMSQEEFINKVGGLDAATLIDITEQAIKLTDDLIIEFDDFLTNFPEHAKTLIRARHLKSYRSLLVFSRGEGEQFIRIREPTPKVDFSSVEKLFEQSSEQLENRYKTGYEKNH